MAKYVIPSFVDLLLSQTELLVEDPEYGKAVLAQPVLLDRGLGRDYELEEWYDTINWFDVATENGALELDYDFGATNPISFGDFIDAILAEVGCYDSDNFSGRLRAHKPELEDDDYVLRPYADVKFVYLEQVGEVGDGMKVCFEF